MATQRTYRNPRSQGRTGTTLVSGVIASILMLIGLAACASPPPQAKSFAATVPSPQATSSPTPQPTEAPTMSPTAAPSPTPPTGNVIKVGNLRTEPRIAPETVIGQLCPNDQVDFLSQQLVGADRWYRVRLTQRAKDCVSTHVALGAEGWASTILVSDPSYPVEQYAQVANITLPTAIVIPTATPRPTATPKPTAVPRPTATPTDVPALPVSSGVRVGAICRDGTRSYATGRGACSHHGGVDHWLVQ